MQKYEKRDSVVRTEQLIRFALFAIGYANKGDCLESRY